MKTAWIPVDERLPEKKGVYLVTKVWSNSGRTENSVRVTTCYFDKGWDIYEADCWKPVAWMDLPSAYVDPMHLKKQILSAEAIYTGSNIFVYMGELENGNFFLATDDTFYNVLILDADPREAGEDAYQDAWQQAHLIKEYVDTDDVFDWFTKMYLFAFDGLSSERRTRIIDMIEYKQSH